MRLISGADGAKCTVVYTVIGPRRMSLGQFPRF